MLGLKPGPLVKKWELRQAILTHAASMGLAISTELPEQDGAVTVYPTDLTRPVKDVMLDLHALGQYLFGHGYIRTYKAHDMKTSAHMTVWRQIDRRIAG